MTARAQSRAVILMLTCLGHAGLILLLAWGIDVAGRRASAREPEPLLMVLLDSLVRPEPQPRLEGPAALATPAEISPIPVPPIDAPSDGALSPPVSDLVPRVDWVGERRREVETVVARKNITAARPTCDPPPARPDAAGAQAAHDCAPKREPRKPATERR